MTTWTAEGGEVIGGGKAENSWVVLNQFVVADNITLTRKTVPVLRRKIFFLFF